MMAVPVQHDTTRALLINYFRLLLRRVGRQAKAGRLPDLWRENPSYAVLSVCLYLVLWTRRLGL